MVTKCFQWQLGDLILSCLLSSCRLASSRLFICGIIHRRSCISDLLPFFRPESLYGTIGDWAQAHPCMLSFIQGCSSVLRFQNSLSQHKLIKLNTCVGSPDIIDSYWFSAFRTRSYVITHCSENHSTIYHRDSNLHLVIRRDHQTVRALCCLTAEVSGFVVTVPELTVWKGPPSCFTHTCGRSVVLHGKTLNNVVFTMQQS